MTLLGREVVRFVAEAAAWVGSEIIIALIAVAGARTFATVPWRRATQVAFLGAVVAAALATRLTLPLGWAPHIGTRPIPILWSLAGAAVALAVWRRIGRRESATG